MNPQFHRLRNRAARLLVALTFTLASVAALLTLTSGTSHWLIELVRYVTYPAFLAPAMLSLMATWWLNRLWRVAALLAVGLVMGPVMGFCTGRPDEGHDRVRLMTFNIKSYLANQRFGGYTEIAEEIQRHAPDLIVLQDAQSLGETDERGTVRRLQTALRGLEVFASGEYVVASRFPMRDCHTEDMSFGTHRRDYVRCIVRAHGTDIDLMTAHFVSPRDGLNATRHERLEGLDDWRENFARRMEQSQKLTAALGQRKRPAIVAGDLNAAESSPVVRTLLAAGLRDAFSSAEIGYGYTHGHSLRLRFSFLRIDHVLVSSELGVKQAFTGEPDASDHRPVVADLWVDRK